VSRATLFLSLPPPPPTPPLFPYTTLFRSPTTTPRPSIERSRFGGTERRHDDLLSDDAPVSRSDLSKGPQEVVDRPTASINASVRSEEHTSELQSRENLVCRLLLEKKKQQI